jgi:hypothetical protein
LMSFHISVRAILRAVRYNCGSASAHTGPESSRTTVTHMTAANVNRLAFILTPPFRIPFAGRSASDIPRSMPIRAISPHYMVFLRRDFEIWHSIFGPSVILSPGNATEIVSPGVLTEVFSRR